MARGEPVGYICWPYDYGSGNEDGPDFTQCVDVRQIQIHEVWTFSDDGVTREVHPTARVDVGNVLVGEFVTN